MEAGQGRVLDKVLQQLEYHKAQILFEVGESKGDRAQLTSSIQSLQQAVGQVDGALREACGKLGNMTNMLVDLSAKTATSFEKLSEDGARGNQGLSNVLKCVRLELIDTRKRVDATASSSKSRDVSNTALNLVLEQLAVVANGVQDIREETAKASPSSAQGIAELHRDILAMKTAMAEEAKQSRTDQKALHSIVEGVRHLVTSVSDRVEDLHQSIQDLSALTQLGVQGVHDMTAEIRQGNAALSGAI